MRSSTPTALDVAENFFASPRLSSALTLVIVATELASVLLRDVIGWPGALAVLGGLVVLASLSLLAQRHMIEWNGLLPISLMVFVGWAAISVFWSQYQWVTVGSVLYFGAVTLLGIYVALVRDTIQIARAFGDVLRAALLLSLALEIFSGVLIDTPLPFLGVAGNLADLGPIQGIFGGRNHLGVIALIAMVTFGLELRTKSVRRGTAIASLVLAAALLLLSRSPVGIGTLVIVLLAAIALYGIRRLKPQHKRIGQIVLLVVALLAAIFAWAYRTPVINAFAASSELTKRLHLWQQVRLLNPAHELEGWGWIGQWRRSIPPYSSIVDAPTSALNAYLDVWLQVGLIGLLLFVGLLGLAFIRSWLLASRQRSVVYAWPALVLVVLIISSLAESSILVEFGWLTFVVCSVKAARELSWRRALAVEPPRQALS
ncbi:MAG: O-antigen ligase family protein [Lacisediminihabitans sp.]